MSSPGKDGAWEYTIEMLAQLAELARREGSERLAARIETVVSAEQSDAIIAGMHTPSKTKK